MQASATERTFGRVFSTNQPTAIGVQSEAAICAPNCCSSRRRLARAPQRGWATPLQVLLVAERAALLSGRDDDFTMIITIACTGLRWGEAIGLEREHTHQDAIHVEWQLRELRSAFHRLPPKDDSYRSPAWEPCLPVDLPPFLAGLLTRQVQGVPGRHRERCGHPVGVKESSTNLSSFWPVWDR